ncbi:MAG TPA: DUF547 domain-containing protein [Alphaproteobacteria bacterium]|nr:DUF547 domain-containing protein [Alphaproteobacteria bacterium]
MRRWLRVFTAIPLLLLLAGFGSGERLFAPSADLWPRWQAHEPESQRTLDHSRWTALLQRYVRTGPNGVNWVDYAAWRDDGREELDRYLAKLQQTAVSRLNRSEQLAYWINLYNALTVDVVLDHYPVESIQDIDISPGLFASGPWDKKLVTVEREKLSLNDIEHRIIRPIWRDPRIHYGVNCASVGCPNLAKTAYRGTNVDAMLTEAAHAYVNDPRGVSINGDLVTVSRIYDWFIEDFGDTEAGVLRHLQQYAEPALRRRLQEIGSLYNTAYDWSLNDTREAPAALQ